MKQDVTEVALYLHVPFCVKKCPYCGFYSIPKNPSRDDQKIYLKAVVDELLLLKEFLPKILKNGLSITFVTFYAGGGTPSLLSPCFYEELFNAIRRIFTFCPVELTLEANPESLDTYKVKKYKEIGINRISLGIQSLSKKGLKFLERGHNLYQGLRALELVSSWFENFSVDFIFGWKGQGEKTLIREIETALAYDPPHFSFYELTLEKKTPFYRRYKGKEEMCKSSNVTKLYRLAEKTLTKTGYIRYEISNYAKPGFECKHNLVYWEVKPYLGLGPGAVSRIGRFRWENPCNFDLYIMSILKKRILPLKIVETLNDLEFAKEYIFMGLRLAKGIDLNLLYERWGFKIKEEILNFLVKKSLVEREKNNLRLTFKGKLLHNKVVSILWENLISET